MIEGYLSGEAGRLAAWLFGSEARGAARADSDVDVAVLVAEAPRGKLEDLHLDWASALEARLGCPVDLVVMNGAPVDLVHRVLPEGELVLERDRSARVAFEVRARREYFDLEPHLRRYRRHVLP